MDYNNLSTFVMDNFDLICYIIDIDNDTIIYMNKAGREAFCNCSSSPSQECLSTHSYLGKKCYEFFKGYHLNCEECLRNKHQVTEAKNSATFKKEIHFKINKKNYYLNSTIVSFNGKNVRLSIAFDISEHMKYVNDLQDKLSLEKTLINCIESLINDVDLDKAILDLLSIVGEYYLADRAYLYEVDPQSCIAKNTFEWSVEKKLATIHTNPIMPIEDLEYVLKSFAIDGELYIEDIYKQLEKDSVLYNLLHETNTRSLLLVPLHTGQKVTSFIGVDNPKRMTDDLTLLHSVSIFVDDDIKKRKLFEELEKLSYFDPLTNIYNRNKYAVRLAELSTLDLKSVGVIHADVNSLKKINEMYGEEYGDSMIKKIAETLKLFVPKELFRVAGDEFIALCIDISQEEFEQMLAKIKKDYAANSDFPFAIGGVWQEKNIDIALAVAQSNELMLMDKQKYYKDNVCKLVQPRSNPLKILLSEIEDKSFIIFLQAKVVLKTGEIVGAEALVRKLDSNKRIVSPDKFVPMYEHDSTIPYLDYFVLEEVCILLKRLIKENRALKIAVNFSRMTFMDYELVDEIKKICAKHEVPHKYIRVEITESIDKMNFEFFARKLEELKNNGFDVSLDDFGAKYSNLLMLSMPAFTEVKIDKGLIDNIASSYENQTIVKNILRTIKELGRSHSLAEGIENIEQVEKLIEFDCTYGQGYYFYRPLPIDEFLDSYDKNKIKILQN